MTLPLARPPVETTTMRLPGQHSRMAVRIMATDHVLPARRDVMISTSRLSLMMPIDLSTRLQARGQSLS